MKSLSSLGIGLSMVFGCLFLALVAELYYLLWWKKRIINREIEDDYSSSSRELFYLLCWKKPTSLSSRALNPHTTTRTSDIHGRDSEDQLHLHSRSGMDYLFKPLGEESIETELMRLHNLSGPPRFLFTIKEETKEDLESDDGRSRGDTKSRKGSRSRSLTDLFSAETPYLTPLSSPPFVTPPLTPINRYNHHGFNPLFESTTEAVVNRALSSPPPKFKFLQDAEEKLQRKLLMESSVMANPSPGPPVITSSSLASDGDGSFITIIIGKNKEKDHHHSSSSQVLPLSSSPIHVTPPSKKI